MLKWSLYPLHSRLHRFLMNQQQPRCQTQMNLSILNPDLLSKDASSVPGISDLLPEAVFTALRSSNRDVVALDNIDQPFNVPI